jgi:hypothetical protein
VLDAAVDPVSISLKVLFFLVEEELEPVAVEAVEAVEGEAAVAVVSIGGCAAADDDDGEGNPDGNALPNGLDPGAANGLGPPPIPPIEGGKPPAAPKGFDPGGAPFIACFII